MKRGKSGCFRNNTPDEAAQRVARETGLPLLPSRVLAARGVTDRFSAEQFLSKSPKTFLIPC